MPHFDTPIIIVGYRNPEDIVGCLRALACAEPQPSFEVFIAENGGKAAFDTLVRTLDALDVISADPFEADAPMTSAVGNRHCRFRLTGNSGPCGPFVNLAEMPDNLGYAGGVNAWLRPLMEEPCWKGAWVLNPDTEPAPDALAQLVAYASLTGKGLIGSRLTLAAEPDHIQTRGLAWHRLRAVAVAVDRYALAAFDPDPEDVERRLDAPSGASVYATRELIDLIGLMREHYFLYFEDLEWGHRAKKVGAVGYAHRAVVIHRGGTTIGTAWRRRNKSPLSVYLASRNRILFVKESYPAWFFWTVAVQLVQIVVFVAVGALQNAVAAWRGLRAGVAGEVGKPAIFVGS